MSKFKMIVAISALGIVFAGCSSDADKTSENLSKAAENFEVRRNIVGINGITDKVLFEIEGRCSLEYSESMKDTLDVICKNGPDSYEKHYVGMSDNVTFVSTQLEGYDADEYRTRIILKPENLIPNFDLQTGDRP